jgi:Fe2+ or Zn2+ uptake regulation protein
MNMQRNTVQRQIVLGALKKMNVHPTIDEIYTKIHKEHPSISKTTVYRNLRLLAASGAIRQISLPDGLERYDGRNDQHYHFLCKNCGSVLDVEMEYLVGINDAVTCKYGVMVEEHDVLFSGVCQKCQK